MADHGRSWQIAMWALCEVKRLAIEQSASTDMEQLLKRDVLREGPGAIPMPHCTWFCLWTENRARKTHVFEKNAISEVSLGWGGVGGHVNVPCIYFVDYSLLRCRDLWDRCYVTCYYAAEISGVVATWHDSTLLMGWGGVGWGGM